MPFRRSSSQSLVAASLVCLGLAVTGSARGQNVGEASVTIGASGDLLFHTRVVDAARLHGFDHLFDGLRRVIRDDEVAFANLETPLSVDREPMRGDPPTLGAPPQTAVALSRAGLDVLSVANNHAWDQRHTGMAATLDRLRDNHVLAVGAAPELDHAAGPVFIRRGMVRVAFVAFTVILQGHPGTRRPSVRISLWDEARARRVLREARAQADIVVASMHWGLAYRHQDRSGQRSRAEFLVEHGADVVLGHGPHVLQRVEVIDSPRGRALVAYSLGNLVSNQGYHFRRGHSDRDLQRPLREPATRDSVWLRVRMDIDRDGQIQVGHVGATPLWTLNNYFEERRSDDVGPDIRVVRLADVPNAELVEERRRAISEVLGDAVELN